MRLPAPYAVSLALALGAAYVTQRNVALLLALVFVGGMASGALVIRRRAKRD